MIDETTSASADGDAVPESNQPAKAGFFVRAEHAVLSLEQRAVAAVEAWYARHFHAAATEGRPPISAEEKASLIAHVSEALTPKE